MAAERLRTHVPPRPRRPVRKSPCFRARRGIASLPMDAKTREAFSLGETVGSLYAVAQRLDMVRLTAFLRGCEVAMNETR